MSTHQFLEFRLCVEAPAISSSIYFSSAIVRFWLVAAEQFLLAFLFIQNTFSVTFFY